ncbi:MAG: hypothetical protein WAN58_10110 [Anaerolineales bacterium]
MNEDLEKYRLALRLQKEGKYQEAVEVIQAVSELGFKAGILIDRGTESVCCVKALLYLKRF